MIRSSIDPLREDIAATSFVVAALAFALALPGAMIFCSHSASRLAAQWLEDFRPVVYLSAEAGESEAAELSDEVTGWSSVEVADVRLPEEAFEQARRRVGKKELSEVGVEPSMFPYSLVVVPATRWANDVELVSRVRALETRELVETVDVPSRRVARVLGWFRWGVLAGLALLVVALAFGIYLLADFLRRIDRRNRSERAILERFGAERRGLKRGTWVRGLVVGLWAGLVAFGLLLVVAITWRGFIDGLWESLAVREYWHWVVVGAPLVIGPLVGVGVGFGVIETKDDGSERLPAGLESMLDYPSRRSGTFGGADE